MNQPQVDSPPPHLRDALDYHEQTKHHLDRYARSLGYMDWATQPSPFRRYGEAPLTPLDHPDLRDQPTYDELFSADVEPHPFDRAAISRLSYCSLALSAWKQTAVSDPWSLRVNPSSGALHPTEGHFIAGPAHGLSSEPAVYHYAPHEHALERRLAFTPEEWNTLTGELSSCSILAALTSIYWRESWKYGERALRYCHHDVGHAIGALAFAAAALGWRAELVDRWSDEQLATLLGIREQTGPEAEHPDCLLLLYPRRAVWPASHHPVQPRPDLLNRFRLASFQGSPNRLSASHHPWELIDRTADACRHDGRPLATPRAQQDDRSAAPAPWLADRGLSAEQIIRERRSALAMDGRTSLNEATFYQLARRAAARDGAFPFDALPWAPQVSLILFLHRVDGLQAGVYALVRDPTHRASLQRSLKPDFAWRKPPACPADVPLFLLQEGDCRHAARVISCHQDIAAEGVLAIGMLAQFEPALREHGAAFYPRLFWETGLVGQLLYLEAEAAGVRATGIGCFFDDAMHQMLGLADRSWQSLYHFTIGGPQDDPRLQTLPAYAHLRR